MLLGDIHLHQKLTENIFYAGSLVQLHMKQNIDHGYVDIDLFNKITKFKRVLNDQIFLNCKYINDEFKI